MGVREAHHSDEASGVRGFFIKMCSGSEAGSYLRLIGFVYHSTLGLRVAADKKKVREAYHGDEASGVRVIAGRPLWTRGARSTRELKQVQIPMHK